MGNCLDSCKDHAPPVVDYAEAINLVVGSDRQCITRVARALAEARGCRRDEVTEAGVRIFTRESSAAPVVIETVPLSIVKDWSRIDNARVWISQNALRKLCGKLVFVVCVVASADCRDEVCREPDPERNRFSWLHLLACVFEQHRQKISILVNSEESTDEASKRLPQLTEILKGHGFGDNVTKFFNFGRGELFPTIKSVLQHAVYRPESDDDSRAIGKGGVMAGPFHLRAVGKHASDHERFGPWGPENMILFGRAGSGKSTLAQMLTLGRLDGLSKKFSASSGLRGATRAVMNGEGRGWRVIDTPGLGESVQDKKSTVCTEKAGRLIREYLMLVEGTYCHFIYVWKRDRIDDLDKRLWNVFVRMFGVDMIENYVTIVVADAEQEWLNKNISALEECFDGCKSFMTVYFPRPDDDDDYDSEIEIQKIRLASLNALEDKLASRSCLLDTPCKMGIWSLSTQKSLAIRGEDESVTMRPSIRQCAAFGPSAGEAHPSDYITARTHIRLKTWKASIDATLNPSSR